MLSVYANATKYWISPRLTFKNVSLKVDCNTPPHLKRKKKKKENNQFLLPKPKKQTIIQRDDKVLRQEKQ
jgi:hypothetical protein